MCLSWKWVFRIMSLKHRRFSLDSSDRHSSSHYNKIPRPSLDYGQLELPELNHSLNNNTSLRDQTIAEDGLHHSDGRISKHSHLKHNKSFHKLFQEIPEEESLTHTFTCALQKEVLYHGKLYVTDSSVCFHSSVLLKETKVVIPASSVQEVKKHNSALSILSVHTADEKYSFVSLRNRELCYKLLQAVCSHIQDQSANSSPHLSSGENEADQDVLSTYSSLGDSISRRNSFNFESGFPEMPSEVPTRRYSNSQNSSAEEDTRVVSVSWIWRITEKVTPFFFLSGVSNISFLIHICMILMVILLLVSGYIGLRITALEEQLNSLGALTEFSLQPRE